ncbi:alpha/beta fold hydrolase [Trinickia caryophylli]|uniref:Pimeloyl-ACP methyl ester carboxylesterase n=1 Tax=Trinickia caryophylli TaxID=28094 RepID=A0A1X7FNM7_TRICW|nr:alpha/beta fold hydrolase [Trinickia caryophylli]PMS13894.1 2-succinyl-6-hydroxy-2,4-cyclohexadiene-1-carboxylate synthase [Trinickia caryophylli]TRX14389.1 alpha/beta fold hydrolase [Trinickia caryophylli]WQE14227.1 alpha/beta fold hydrolase [Trinickia caryophylli]SMF55798.1 Pimeloyl-ACP methyl ester carboxylesterase [Trinickia caryophylli]GLU33265.1 2-succinyl-6-hydroxy-2,4-cyclohexadiene-1-carboxylate synthase [Trinickia caryophylli]
MPFIEIDGQQLHYRIEGAGFPVLLGHSYLWDASMWAPQIEALSRHYKVIVPDLWGHGQSGCLPGNTRTLGDLAAQTSRLLDALDIGQCAIVGLSVGGMWGSELALREPGRVRCLVMMDADRGAEPEVTRTRYFQMLDTIESTGSIPAPMIEAIVPLFFRQGATLTDDVHVNFRKALAAFSAEQLRQSVVPLGRLIFGRPDELARLGGLDAATTLLMCGELDIPRPPAEMARMAEAIGCSQRVVPGAGHISNLENPSFVNEALLAWLARHVA